MLSFPKLFSITQACTRLDLLTLLSSHDFRFSNLSISHLRRLFFRAHHANKEHQHVYGIFRLKFKHCNEQRAQVKLKSRRLEKLFYQWESVCVRIVLTIMNNHCLATFQQGIFSSTHVTSASYQKI